MSKRYMIIICLIQIGCIASSRNEFFDYSYNGTFDRYRTFSLATNFKSKEDPTINSQIDRSISRILGSWGYVEDKIEPDLLIMTTIYLAGTELDTFRQPDLKKWIKEKYVARNQTDLEAFKSEGIRSYKKAVYQKEEREFALDMLMISFFDTKNNEMVWRNYVALPNSNLNSRVIWAVVHAALDNYRLIESSAN